MVWSHVDHSIATAYPFLIFAVSKETHGRGNMFLRLSEPSLSRREEFGSGTTWRRCRRPLKITMNRRNTRSSQSFPSSSPTIDACFIHPKKAMPGRDCAFCAGQSGPDTQKACVLPRSPTGRGPSMDRAKATTERRRETNFLLALCVVLGFPGDACPATSVVIPTPPPRPPGLQSPELGTPEPRSARAPSARASAAGACPRLRPWPGRLLRARHGQRALRRGDGRSPVRARGLRHRRSVEARSSCSRRRAAALGWSQSWC